MAEGRGFEPLRQGYCLLVFKTDFKIYSAIIVKQGRRPQIVANIGQKKAVAILLYAARMRIK